jgi:hypothetical protein
VLKAELDFLLGRYDNIDFREANYQKYGQGATEVYIKQVVSRVWNKKPRFGSNEGFLIGFQAVFF